MQNILLKLLKCLLVCLYIIINHSWLSAQPITTFAGGGSNTTGLGDGGPATASWTSLPGFGSFDMVGNYYFSEDFSAPRVRMVNTAGTISTVVGIGISGFSGDEGPATDAEIGPSSIKVDAAGNIYIADYYNYRVRKVDAGTGIIHTIAGNGTATHTGDGSPATASTLVPSDLCVDRFGNIYIFDSARVRKIDASGIITTIAGNGVGGFAGDNGPATAANILVGIGICTDTIGNVYIGCNSGTRVRKIDISTGIITSVGGTGTYLYNGENIPATTAQFKEYGLAFDAYGNLFMADYGNQRIRMIDTNGMIHTVAGTGIAGYSGDGGLADTAKIHNPEGVAFDYCGNLYIADEANNRVRKVTFNPNCNDTTHTDTTNAVQNIKSGGFSVYPNPASKDLTLTLSEGEGNITSVAIINMLGQVAYNKAFVQQQKITIDISALPNGVYFVKVNGVHVEKVLKE